MQCAAWFIFRIFDVEVNNRKTTFQRQRAVRKLPKQRHWKRAKQIRIEAKQEREKKLSKKKIVRNLQRLTKFRRKLPRCAKSYGTKTCHALEMKCFRAWLALQWFVWVDECLYLATETHSTVTCACKYVVEYKQHIFFFIHSIFAMQLEMLPIGTVMNCHRIFRRQLVVHLFWLSIFGYKHTLLVVYRSISAFSVRRCVYSYHRVTGALEDVFLCNRPTFFFFYRLINFICMYSWAM